MPGQIVSVPFMSQIEDVDKYLTEYRTLKLMPQGTAVGLQQGPTQQAQFRNHGRSGSHGAGGAQRKRLSQVSSSGGLGQYGIMNADTSGGSAVGKRFHVNGLQKGYGGQQMLNPLQGTYQKSYGQMFYPGSGKVGSESSVSLPIMSATQQGAGHQQNFMASSSSSGSTSPSRIQTSISGGSAVNSLGSEYSENIMTGDFHGQYDGVGFGHTSSPSPAINNFNMGSPFVQTSSPPTSNSSGANDFMQVLPSSLLNDGGVSSNMATLTGSRSMVASMFSPNQFSSSSTQSSFATLHTAASTWGNPSTLSTAGSTSVDQPSASSTTSGSFGIWNNDMSVWG